MKIKEATALFEAQLKTIADQTTIENDFQYRIKGHSFRVLNPQPHLNYFGELSDFGANELNGEAEQWLQHHLSGNIYRLFYAGMSHKDQPFDSLPDEKERNAFMDALSMANKTEEGWDTFWKVYNVDASGNAFAKKNETLRPVYANNWKFSMPNTKSLAVDALVDFKVIKENRELQSVFYFVYGKQQPTADDEMMRIYWSIKPEGAVKLVEQVTTLFNQYLVPFQFKCLNHASLYERTDSAVLYFNKSSLHLAVRLVDKIATSLAAYLREDLPLFTIPLHTGVAFAEDPGNQQSFGMSRSEMIAKGLVKAYQAGQNSTAEKLAAIQQQLASKGLSLDRLFLHHHSNPEFVLDQLQLTS